MIGSDLGLTAAALRGAAGPLMLIDFVEGRYERPGEIAPSFSALSGVSFGRSGAGTALTSAGAIQSFASGAPRITDRGLLLEEARTNLAPRSNDPGNAGWAANLVTKGGTGLSDPFGLTQARQFTANGQSGNHSFGPPNGTFATGTVYSLSVIVKPVGANTRVQVTGTGAVFGTTQYANFNLTGAGSVTASTGLTGPATITALADGFYLCALGVTSIAASAGALPVALAFITSGSDPRAPTNTSTGALITAYAGAEAGASASSPIVTGAGAATRGADATSLIVPAAASTLEATYGDAGTQVSFAVTPGATFDLVAGRPWIGLGKALRRVVVR